jgi:hypothetical protein
MWPRETGGFLATETRLGIRPVDEALKATASLPNVLGFELSRTPLSICAMVL